MMKHFKRVLNKLKCKELVSNTLELHIITVRGIDASNIHINISIAKKCNIAMQDCTCNWDRATAVRQETANPDRLLTLASIATLSEH